jgi:hypothetical protein
MGATFVVKHNNIVRINGLTIANRVCDEEVRDSGAGKALMSSVPFNTPMGFHRSARSIRALGSCSDGFLPFRNIFSSR